MGTSAGEKKRRPQRPKHAEGQRAVLLSKMVRGSSVPRTPGLGARTKDPSVPFRPRPLEQSSGPCPGCSPRTPRTCRCPGAWPGEWSASWWYCRSRRTPWQGERGGRAAVRLQAPGARLVSQLWSSLRVPRPRPAPAGALGPLLPPGKSPPSPVILLDVLPVLGPANVRRRLAHDLRGQRHGGAFACFSVIRSLLNLRRD